MEQKIERTFVKQEEEESRKNNNNKKMCGKRAGCTERSGYVVYKSNIDRKRLKARMKAIKLMCKKSGINYMYNQKLELYTQWLSNQLKLLLSVRL